MNRCLIQLYSIPFRVTDRSATFQKTRNRMVKETNLHSAFLYINNIRIAEYAQEESDENVKRFLETIDWRKL